MVHSQRAEVGPKLRKDSTAFGVGSGFLSTCEPTSNPFLFSSLALTCDINKERNAKPSRKPKHGSCNGEKRKVGNLLQRENHPNRERNNQMDKAGPNRDLGVVRVGFNDSLEEHLSSHGDQHEVGMAADEGRSLGEHAKSLVEVPDRQTGSTNPSNDQLGVVSNRIRGANLRKISSGGRSRLDRARNHGAEGTSKQADRVLATGESPQSEVDAVRETSDQPNNTHQGLSGLDGDYQALGHPVQGATGVEDSSPRSIEVERH